MGSTVSYKFILFCYSSDFVIFLLSLNILSLIPELKSVQITFKIHFFYVFSLIIIKKDFKICTLD